MSGTKVVRHVTAQPTRDRGISNFVRTRAYFRVPALTMPHRNWKRVGRTWATSFDTHRLSQTTSTQEKNHTIRTPPIVADLAAVAPATIGAAMIKANGRTYRK